MAKKIKILAVLVLLLTSFWPAITPAKILAKTKPSVSVCNNYSGALKEDCNQCLSDGNGAVCSCFPETKGGRPLTRHQLDSCVGCNKPTKDLNSQAQTCLKENVIVKDLNVFINVLAGLVGVVAVIMIITGGVQYSLARNNPQTIAAARGRIANALLAVVALMFIWAFLNYLIPGGIF